MLSLAAWRRRGDTLAWNLSHLLLSRQCLSYLCAFGSSDYLGGIQLAATSAGEHFEPFEPYVCRIPAHCPSVPASSATTAPSSSRVTLTHAKYSRAALQWEMSELVKLMAYSEKDLQEITNCIVFTLNSIP